MGKDRTRIALRALREVAEAMAARPEQGAPEADCRLLRELASRLLSSDDAWSRLVLESLDHAFASLSDRGPLALVEPLRELDRSQSD